jgi:hypothetical protein
MGHIWDLSGGGAVNRVSGLLILRDDRAHGFRFSGSVTSLLPESLHNAQISVIAGNTVGLRSQINSGLPADSHHQGE